MSDSTVMTQNAPAKPVKRPEPRSSEERVQNHQILEWSPGTYGGGKVPEDFEWRTNPKQEQEEDGTPQ